MIGAHCFELSDTAEPNEVAGRHSHHTCLMQNDGVTKCQTSSKQNGGVGGGPKLKGQFILDVHMEGGEKRTEDTKSNSLSTEFVNRKQLYARKFAIITLIR